MTALHPCGVGSSPVSALPLLVCCSKLTNKKATESRGRKKVPVSYSAARLQEKGVLLEIQDLPTTQ